MTRKPVRGLFVTGTDTDVGKTYVGAMIARALVGAGYRVGVYKPVASGCRHLAGTLVSDDALSLWKAAGSPGTLHQVCPQRFAAPRAPHLAAAAEGKTLDSQLLREGLKPWLVESDVVLVEGAGGLMSPLGARELVADVAADFGFPLLVVARNRVGAINHVLQTLVAASAAGRGAGLKVAGIVLTETEPGVDAEAARETATEIRRLASAPVLAELSFKAESFQPPVDWFNVAAPSETLAGALPSNRT